MKQLPPGYTVYCDESRHDGSNKNPYMAIGGMWVPTDKKQDLTRQLRQLLRDSDIGSEVKWSKTSHQKTEAYQTLVDFFFTHDLNFRVIWLEPLRNGGFKFSTAYPPPRKEIERYTKRARKIWSSDT